MAQASTTTVRTVISGDGQGSGATAQAESGDALADALNGFDGVALDAEATAAIQTALLACAARQREAVAAMDSGGEAGVAAEMDDPANGFVRVDGNDPYWGTLEPPCDVEDFVPFGGDEAPWEMAGAAVPEWAVEAEAAKAKGPDGDSEA